MQETDGVRTSSHVSLSSSSLPLTLLETYAIDISLSFTGGIERNRASCRKYGLDDIDGKEDDGKCQTRRILFTSEGNAHQVKEGSKREAQARHREGEKTCARRRKRKSA